MRLTPKHLAVVLAAATVPVLGGCAAASERVDPPTNLFAVEVAGKGPPMILIPGGMSSGDVWKGTVAHYDGRYETHVLTLAGFAGQPPADATPFFPAVREALAGYIRERRLQRPVIVGHSLGGFLALSFATEHPGLVGKLVVVDSVPAPGATRNPDISTEEREAMAQAFADSYARASDADRRRMIATMAQSPAHVDLIASWGTASDPETVHKALMETVLGDVRSDLPRIEAPILVLVSPAGDGSAADREGVERMFRQQFANADDWRLEVAPSARHFIMYDDPAWMFEKMDEFLSHPGPVR